MYFRLRSAITGALLPFWRLGVELLLLQNRGRSFGWGRGFSANAGYRYHGFRRRLGLLGSLPALRTGNSSSGSVIVARE
jgi:hypothetical protein